MASKTARTFFLFFSIKVYASAEDTQLAYRRVYPEKKKKKKVIQEIHSDRHKRQKAYIKKPR